MFQFLFGRAKRQPARRTSSRRPNLEALEDRALLSVTPLLGGLSEQAASALLPAVRAELSGGERDDPFFQKVQLADQANVVNPSIRQIAVDTGDLRTADVMVGTPDTRSMGTPTDQQDALAMQDFHKGQGNRDGLTVAGGERDDPFFRTGSDQDAVFIKEVDPRPADVTYMWSSPLGQIVERDDPFFRTGSDQDAVFIKEVDPRPADGTMQTVSAGEYTPIELAQKV